MHFPSFSLVTSSQRRPARRRAFALGALWLAISTAALLAPGCYGRNCDGGSETFGIGAGQGRMLDETSWESSGFDETWLWYPRQRTYVFDIPALGGRWPSHHDLYLSMTPEPNASNATLASGDAVKFTNFRPNGFDLTNDTCTDFWLRVYVEVPSRPPETPPSPSTDGDAGDSDAGDASVVDD
jgi:hypothetical protein